MKKLFVTLLFIFLSFSLTGCSQKEMIIKPVIDLSYSNVYSDQITIENNDIINLGDLQNILIHFDANWSYEIEKIMSSPNLPKIELQKLKLRYSIYLDDELIEDNLGNIELDEYEEQYFKVDTGFFKTTAIISESLFKSINLTVKGTYLIQLELNIKVDGIIKNYLTELNFQLE